MLVFGVLGGVGTSLIFTPAISAIGHWFYVTWVYEVLLGIIFGAILGYGFRHLMKFCERNELIDRQSFVAQYVSLALLAIGCTTLLGSDDLLAAFSCGTAFAWDGEFSSNCTCVILLTHSIPGWFNK